MALENENKRSFGSAGEKAAADFLQLNGYEIIIRNYRVGRLGEIDIIAKEKDYICFVEVKTRSSIFFGMPSEAVNWKKQESILRIASIYMDRNKLNQANIRFDIVEVIMDRKDKTVRDINLIRNAF